MEIGSLPTAIFWSVMVSRSAYRVLRDWLRNTEYATWEIVVDVLLLIGGFAMAIYLWIKYAKGKKENKENSAEK